MTGDPAPHVVYAFDQGFRFGSLFSAWSVLRHRDGPTRISFFVPKPMPGLEAAVAALGARFPEATAEIRTEPELDLDFDTGGDWPAMTYARLFLPRFITRGRILYLDGDTIARRDIGALFGLDMGARPIGAARDAGVERAMHARRDGAPGPMRPRLAPILAAGGLIDPDTYFNAGVLLIDIDRARDLGVLERIFDPDSARALVTRHRLKYADQDWLNHAAHGLVHTLAPEWNSAWGNRCSAQAPFTRARRDAYRVSRDDPAILHLTGAPKPWQSQPRRDAGEPRHWRAHCERLMDDMARDLGRDLRQSLL